jgi:hypothetical protein
MKIIILGASASSSFYHIHVHLTELIIKNRAVLGNPRLVQISAAGASTRHTVEFLKTKGIADVLLLQQTNVVVIRPSIVCTHRTMIVRKMLMLSSLARYTGGFVFVPKGFLNTRIQPVMPQNLVDLVEVMCSLNDQHTVYAVGPEPIRFRSIIEMMFEVKKMTFRFVEVPKLLTDILVRYGINIFFPNLINSQQYQLLFEDNIADAIPMQQLINVPLISSQQFFINEFTHGTN